MSITVGINGVTFPDGSSQNTATQYGMKNRIINGDMRIDQRNAGASVTPAGGATYLVDRFSYISTQASKVSAQQVSIATNGFTSALKFTSLSSYSSLSTDYLFFAQKIEGYNVADLSWGTVNAKPITLSFVVNSSLTGTFGGALINSSGNMNYVFSYSIPVANTDTTISVTIPGPTSGTWLTNNGEGIQVRWNLGSGSNYLATANVWGATNLMGPTGAVSITGTSGATFYITGVQLEKGSTATSFDYRAYGTELVLCQRYFEKSYNIDVAPGINTLLGAAFKSGSTNQYNDLMVDGQFSVQKRATPTMTFYQQATGTAGVWNTERSGSVGTTTAFNYATGMTKWGCYFPLAAAFVSASCYGHWVASAEL